MIGGTGMSGIVTRVENLFDGWLGRQKLKG